MRVIIFTASASVLTALDDAREKGVIGEGVLSLRPPSAADCPGGANLIRT